MHMLARHNQQVGPWRIMFTGAVVACVLSAGRFATADTPETVQDLQDGVLAAPEVNDLLNLRAGNVFSLALQATAGESLAVSVPINGRMHTLDLDPHSVRSDTYKVTAQLADGSYADIEPGPPQTFRGAVRGVEGSAVGASLLDDGLRARIILADGTAYWVEPVGSTAAGGEPGLHAVYRGDDVIAGGGHCAALHPPLHADELANKATGGAAAAGLYIAELAIDTDYEYFQEFGSVEATVAQIETVINAVNVQYERDVSIRHAITQIIVRTAEPDPYDATGATQLLYQFSNHWRSAHASIPRDVAQLFTGKDMDSNTIGIAWVGGICSASYGYSVVESNCGSCGSLACKSDLSAHELGHNWGAGHCGDEDGVYDCSPRCPEYTMDCYLTCRNRFHETLTIPEIVGYRDRRTCLDLGDELRRIILSAPGDNVTEGGTLQFTAVADFRFGDDRDVTAEAQWSVDRPAAASIDSTGRLTASDVDGNVCVTVSALYTADGLTRTNSMTIVVVDLDTPFAVIAGVPPDGAVDARQPCEPNGSNPAGWQALDIVFNGETCLTVATDFAIAQEGGRTAAPLMAGFEHIGPSTVRIYLSRVIEPGAWTTLTHVASGTGISVGYLPGDANADGVAGPVDILALIDNLNERVDPPFAVWRCDIDRSSACSPADILRLIDLLNGADSFEPWLGRALP